MSLMRWPTGLSMRRLLRTVAVIVTAVVVLSACTSTETSELLEAHPELSDLQLDSAERTRRGTSSSLDAAFPTYNDVTQYYVPRGGESSYDALAEEIVALAEDLGWEVSFNEPRNKWSGCMPSPSDSSVGHHLRVRVLEASGATGAAKEVFVQLLAGSPCS